MAELGRASSSSRSSRSPSPSFSLHHRAGMEETVRLEQLKACPKLRQRDFQLSPGLSNVPLVQVLFHPFFEADMWWGEEQRLRDLGGEGFQERGCEFGIGIWRDRFLS